jgi:hypothetical protein
MIDDYFTNESEDSTAPRRVIIPSFTLTIYPTHNFARKEEDIVMDAANDALNSYIPIQLPDNIVLDYAGFTRDSFSRARTLWESNTTTLEVSGGVASFHGGEPAAVDVNRWTSEAMEGVLLDTLQQETELSYVESIIFYSMTSAPTPAPTPMVVGALSGDGAAWVTVGAVAGLLVAILAILFVWRRVAPGHGRNEKVSEMNISTPNRSHELDEDLSFSFETNQNCHSNDEESVSTSDEATISTNTTAAFTLKSGKRFPCSGHSLMQTESFERERQLSLKKDMLQTPWLVATPPCVYISRETDLQPSVKPTKSPDYWIGDDTRDPNDTATDPGSSIGNQSPFLFQAPGEEVVLMPPNQTRSSRSSGSFR